MSEAKQWLSDIDARITITYQITTNWHINSIFFTAAQFVTHKWRPRSSCSHNVLNKHINMCITFCYKTSEFLWDELMSYELCIINGLIYISSETIHLCLFFVYKHHITLLFTVVKFIFCRWLCLDGWKPYVLQCIWSMHGSA